MNAIATFGVPTDLQALAPSSLEFDQICITEATFDFCIVEVSTNDGLNWTELARYDQSADPGWEDNVADPTDWRHVSLNLAAYGGQQLLIRFRLQSDQLLQLDGWYVDNLHLEGCGAVPALVQRFDATGEAGGVRLHLDLSEESPGAKAVVYRGLSADQGSRVVLTPDPLPVDGTSFE